MKKTITNILSTTSMSIILLAIIGIFSGAHFLPVNGFFQILAANTVIHVGYLLTQKFESEYAVLEATVDIVYTIIVLIFFGILFDWLPIWILIIMAVVIYVVGLLLDLFRMHDDINTINRLLQKRNNKVKL